jgi:hypothetical protein
MKKVVHAGRVTRSNAIDMPGEFVGEPGQYVVRLNSSAIGLLGLQTFVDGRNQHDRKMTVDEVQTLLLDLSECLGSALNGRDVVFGSLWQFVVDVIDDEAYIYLMALEDLAPSVLIRLGDSLALRLQIVTHRARPYFLCLEEDNDTLVLFVVTAGIGIYVKDALKARERGMPDSVLGHSVNLTFDAVHSLDTTKPGGFTLKYWRVPHAHELLSAVRHATFPESLDRADFYQQALSTPDVLEEVTDNSQDIEILDEVRLLTLTSSCGQIRSALISAHIGMVGQAAFDSGAGADDHRRTVEIGSNTFRVPERILDGLAMA